MAGYDFHNFPLFTRTAKFLRNMGHEIKSPHELDNNDPTDPSWSWVGCMKRDVVLLLECDCIVLLPHWSQSRGATIEAMIAYLLKYPVYFVDVENEDEPGSYMTYEERKWPVARLIAGFFNCNLRKVLNDEAGQPWANSSFG